MQWLNSEQVLDLLKSLIWPVVVLIVFFTLMVPLSSALKGSDVSDIQVGTSGVSLSFDKKRLENVEPTESVASILPKLDGRDLEKIFRMAINHSNLFCEINPSSPSSISRSARHYAPLIEAGVIQIEDAKSPNPRDECPSGQFKKATFTDEGVEVKSFLETVLLTSISIEELDD